MGCVNPHEGDTDPASASPTAPGAPMETEPAASTADQADTVLDPLDLARIERDLDGVETALRRLDDGSYWTDEVTGAALPDEVLEADPVARRIES